MLIQPTSFAILYIALTPTLHITVTDAVRLALTPALDLTAAALRLALRLTLTAIIRIATFATTITP